MEADKMKEKLEALKTAIVLHENGWANGPTRMTGVHLFECAKGIPFDELENLIEGRLTER